MIRPDDRTPDERQQDKAEDAGIQPGPLEYRAAEPMPIGGLKQIVLLRAAMRVVEKNMRNVILAADSCRLPIDVALAACAKDIDDQEATEEEIATTLQISIHFDQGIMPIAKALKEDFIIIRRPK